MNALNKPRGGHVSVVVNQLTKRDQKNVTIDSSLANKSSVINGEFLLGLCYNCENNAQCAWQRENKIFCEHYE